MLAGEIQRLEKQIQALQSQLRLLREKIGALDVTMSLFDSSVRPDSGGIVCANAKYGKRGALIRRVEAEIKDAGLAGVDTVTLSIRVAVHFGIDLHTKQDLTRFRKDTVGWVVRFLKGKGLVEDVFASRGGHAPSVWRLKPPPSLCELARLSAQPGRPT